MIFIYAEVIVDVPTMQTNQAYTYEISDEFSAVKVGMRVAVPFGKGNRKVLGFITEIKQKVKNDLRLKKIYKILDLEPVLSTEMLDISSWLATETFAFKIKCLQALLPNSLRANYKATIKIVSDIPKIKQIFGNKTEVNVDIKKIDSNVWKELVWLKNEKKVTIRYHIEDKHKVKYVIGYNILLNDKRLLEEKEKLAKNAVNQQKLLGYLIKKSEQKFFLKENLVKELKLTSSVFKTAILKGWIEEKKIEKYRIPNVFFEIKKESLKKLTDEQLKATQNINDRIDKNKHETFLLQGVTGSGKTEVYLQTIEHALKKGKKALMLVPEISLTPQMVSRVKARFGKMVAVLHSGLSNGEKYDEWRRIKRDEAKVVIGARSAIFAPLDNLGVIIVDEEHEASYKQEEMPKYHARDVAIWRGKYHQCPVVLGSATPSLESKARAQKKIYHLLKLTKRINGKPLPHTKLVDMKKAVLTAPTQDISAELIEKIKSRLAKKEQVVLMLNRRGYSSFVMCRECGFVLKCPNCDISLNLHMDTHSMQCHYCGHLEPMLRQCPNCKSNKIRYYGTGTQKIEEQLKKILPEVRILRMDVDTTRKKGSHARILEKFRKYQADILLGTQMIAKGLDFENVTLVGVLNADTSLELPDFRSSEKTFQLLTQVSGRAGRGDKEGEVIVQTYNSMHYAIQLAKIQDYEKFYRKEMNFRHKTGYPPYYYIIKIIANYADEASAAKKLFQIRGQLQQVLSPKAQILGPTPQLITRIKNRYYYQLVIKYKKEINLDNYLQNLLTESQKESKNGFITIEKNPLNFM